MQFGPVPQHYPWIEEDLFQGGDLVAEEIFFRNGDSHITMHAGRGSDLSLFTAEEVATLNRIAGVLGHETSKRLSQLSHEERAWTGTALREMIPYEMAHNLSL